MQSRQVPDEPDESQAADLLPILDEAMSSLGEADRETILLRFFCKRSLAEIGHALGVSEDAAQKRVARALDRLRRRFQRRGLAASTGAVLVVLGTAGSQAAPVGTVAALVTSSIVATLGVPAPAAATTLLAGVSSLSAMKVPLGLTALVAVTATAPLVIQQRQVSAALAENWRLQDQAAQESLRRDAVAERGEARRSIVGELEQLGKNHQELLRLQSEVAGFNSEEVRAKSEWLRRLERTRADLTAAQEATGRIEENIASEELHTKRIDDLKQLGLAARIVEMEHQDTFPTTFEALTNSTGGLDFGPYEYVQHGRPLTEADGDLILFREKEARRLPNGKWRRSYTMVDGSVRTIDSDTGDYQEWERPLIAQPGPANIAGSER
jgi:ElaB/YqjD/DUF883 family membrane-anchored ribosome-binding protein